MVLSSLSMMTSFSAFAEGVQGHSLITTMDGKYKDADGVPIQRTDNWEIPSVENYSNDPSQLVIMYDDRNFFYISFKNKGQADIAKRMLLSNDKSNWLFSMRSAAYKDLERYEVSASDITVQKADGNKVNLAAYTLRQQELEQNKYGIHLIQKFLDWKHGVHHTPTTAVSTRSDQKQVPAAPDSDSVKSGNSAASAADTPPVL